MKLHSCREQLAEKARPKLAQTHRVNKYSEDFLKTIQEIFPGISHRFVDDLLLNIHLSLVL